MSWLWIATTLLLVGALVGFVGLAVVSTPQYFVATAICAIATYWMALANKQDAA